MQQLTKEQRSQRLLLRAINFDSRAEADYARCPIESKENNLELMRQLSENGVVKIVAIEKDGKRIGTLDYVVYEHESKGKVLWIIGIGADSDEQSEMELYAAIGDQVADILDIEGCEWCRAEAPRAGIYRKLIRTGFIPARVEMYGTREMFNKARDEIENFNK